MASAMARALLLAALPVVLAGVMQKPLMQEDATQPLQALSTETQPQRKLHGRFLHITDIHPDPFYKLYTSTAEGIACHRSTGPAGYYGAETSDCDSPFSLVNATFHWIAQNLANKIDFVIWTGDSARHDNDEHHPRSTSSVVSLNRFLVQKFEEVFGVDEKVPGGSGRRYKIPIVPSFGNNDILPHNLFFKGPNGWTRTYGDVWRGFIPEEQRHGFERGGWFYVEVVPGSLAVFSLNTMYFFDANTAVDGCARHTEPGYEHMEWLRIQLQFLRERGVKAIMSGHVPPARNEEKAGWDETCWQKYALWMRQYRDVVVGSVYGHMNIEHFVLQDFADVDLKEMGVEEWDDGDGKGGDEDETDDEDENEKDDDDEDDGNDISAQVKAPDYLTALRDLWARLPVAPSDELSTPIAIAEDDASTYKKRKPRRTALQKYHDKIGGQYAERFAVSHISASVVPNFFSTLRVYEYNITGVENVASPGQAPTHSVPAWPERIDDVEEPTPSSLTPGRLITSSIRYLLTQLNVVSRITNSLTEDLTPSNPTTTTKLKPHHRRKHKHRKHKHRKHKHRNKKPSFTVPDPPAEDAPPGPAYSPQALSWTGYVQYVANNTWLNNDFTHDDPTSDGLYEEGWNPGRYTDRTPPNRTKSGQPKPKPRPFEFHVEYNTSEAKDDYALGEGLTVRKWVELAARIGEFRGRGESVHPDTTETRCEDEEDCVSDSGSDCEGEGAADCEVILGRDEDDDDAAAVNTKKPNHSNGKEKKHDKKHKHKKKKHKEKKHKRKIINRDWYAFVSRAVTGTLSDAELHDQFGEVDALAFSGDDDVDDDGESLSLGDGNKGDGRGSGEGNEDGNEDTSNTEKGGEDLVCDAEGSDCHVRSSEEEAETYPVRAQTDGSKIIFDPREQGRIWTHRAEAEARRRGTWGSVVEGELGY